MAVNLSPVGGAAAQFFDNSGNVLTGGKLYTYLAGTTTPAITYTNNSGSTPHSNPIVLNAAGRVPDSGEIWLTDSILYKFVLKDSNDVQIATWDNIDGINSNFIAYATQNETATATQGQTVFTLTTITYQPATSNLAVYVNGSKQVLTLNYIETSSTVVTFVDGLNVGDVVQFTTASAVATNVAIASNVAFTGFKGQVGNVQNLADDDGSDWIGFIANDTNAVARSAQDKMRETISVKDFGALGDGTTDDTIAIQTAVDESIANDYALYFPSGTYLVSDTITIEGKFTIFGEGSTSVITTNDNTLAIFTITPVGNLYQCSLSNLAFLGQGGILPDTHCAIRFTGTDIDYIEHSIFESLYSFNFYAFVIGEIDPHTTGFGLEGNLSWNVWNNIQIVSVRQYGFWFKQGSGTGNSFDNVRCRTGIANSAAWFFEGTGCVVGDVIITNAHLLTNASPSIGIQIGDDTVYRAQWAISNCQFDAGCDIPVLMSAVGTEEYVNWNITDNNYGGNANLGDTLEPMNSAVVIDRDVSWWQAGANADSNVIGANTIKIGDVVLGNSGSCAFDINVSGVIGGVLGATSTYKYFFRTDNVTAETQLVEYDLSGTSTNYTITTTNPDANTTSVFVNFTPTAVDSHFRATITGSGYLFKIVRA